MLKTMFFVLLSAILKTMHSLTGKLKNAGSDGEAQAVACNEEGVATYDKDTWRVLRRFACLTRSKWTPLDFPSHLLDCYESAHKRSALILDWKEE